MMWLRWSDHFSYFPAGALATGSTYWVSSSASASGERSLGLSEDELDIRTQLTAQILMKFDNQRR
jgi:hypothetical protein